MKPVVCIGAAIVDDIFHCIGEPAPGTSNPSSHYRSAGGVSRNVAHHLAQLGIAVELISYFGSDTDGAWLRDLCASAGIGLSHSRFTEGETGRYTAILSPSGELYAGASDTHLENEITVPFLSKRVHALESASVILCDCNLPISSIRWLLAFSRDHAIPCIIEPVSVAKAALLKDVDLTDVLLITPNDAEVSAILGDSAQNNPASAIKHLLARGVQNIWLRKGRDGSELFTCEETIRIAARHVDVVDETGAGDAALAGWIYAWLRKKSARECILYGHAMAEIILKIEGAHANRLDTHSLESVFLNLKTQ